MSVDGAGRVQYVRQQRFESSRGFDAAAQCYKFASRSKIF